MNLTKRVKNPRSYKSTQKFVQGLGIKSQEQWRKYCKTHKIPIDIPRTPEGVYKNKGWKSYPDLLGTRNYKKIKWRNFNKAKKFARSLKIKKQSEWYRYWKKHKKPIDIPSSPPIAYKEWTSWGDWLGNGNISPRKRTYPDFETAKKIVRKEKIISSRHYRSVRPKNKNLQKLHCNPEKYYKQWISWSDFLGPNYSSKEFTNFKNAQKIVQRLRIKSKTEYESLAKQGKLPKELPHKPQVVYGRKKCI